jgi:hypothetical protein
MVVVNWRSERALPCRVRSKYYRQLLQSLRRSETNKRPATVPHCEQFAISVSVRTQNDEAREGLVSFATKFGTANNQVRVRRNGSCTATFSVKSHRLEALGMNRGTGGENLIDTV